MKFDLLLEYKMSSWQWNFSNDFISKYFWLNFVRKVISKTLKTLWKYVLHRDDELYWSVHWRCSIKKMYLKISQISQETTYESLLNKAAGLELYQKETLTQLLSCEICEIFKNAYFEDHLRTAASGYIKISC